MKRFISAISAVSIIVSSLSAFSFQASAEEDEIKIMCIGDSITDGYIYDYVGSYRKFIYHNLTEKGYNVDMVGAKGDGWSTLYTDEETGEMWEFDNGNNGYSGYAIKAYNGRQGIYETLIETGSLASAKPDIVTLQIGTNDIIDNHEIDEAGERLEILVDYIVDNIPDDSVLFVSLIPDVEPNRSDVYEWFGNYRHSADWSEQYDDETAEEMIKANIESYNGQIEKLVEKKSSEDKNVFISYAGREITDVRTQLFDGVHPNNAGYKAIGEKWTEILTEYLGGKSPEEKPFKINDLVRLSYYVLGYPFETYTKEDVERYDINKDGRTDVFDVILMREAVAGYAEKIVEKRKELGDESFLDLSELANVVIYPDEYYETATTSRINGSSSGSHNYYVTVTGEDDEGNTTDFFTGEIFS